MADIHVGRYDHPAEVGYQGWIEPGDRSWVMFVDLDGRPVVFLDRDLATGAVPGRVGVVASAMRGVVELPRHAEHGPGHAGSRPHPTGTVGL